MRCLPTWWIDREKKKGRAQMAVNKTAHETVCESDISPNCPLSFHEAISLRVPSQCSLLSRRKQTHSWSKHVVLPLNAPQKCPRFAEREIGDAYRSPSSMANSQKCVEKSNTRLSPLHWQRARTEHTIWCTYDDGNKGKPIQCFVWECGLVRIEIACKGERKLDSMHNDRSSINGHEFGIFILWWSREGSAYLSDKQLLRNLDRVLGSRLGKLLTAHRQQQRVRYTQITLHCNGRSLSVGQNTWALRRLTTRANPFQSDVSGNLLKSHIISPASSCLSLVGSTLDETPAATERWSSALMLRARKVPTEMLLQDERPRTLFHRLRLAKLTKSTQNGFEMIFTTEYTSYSNNVLYEIIAFTNISFLKYNVTFPATVQQRKLRKYSVFTLFDSSGFLLSSFLFPARKKTTPW